MDDLHPGSQALALEMPAREAAKSLARPMAAEGVGTALLLAIVVGSGIMADRLAPAQPAVALLANGLATAGGLIVLILAFGPLSGAHFNPVVTLVEARRGALPWPSVPGYLAAQIAGAFGGVLLAHGMFEVPLVEVSHHARAGGAQFASEIVATFGLVLTILAVSRARAAATPYAVGLYILAAYWFTASTSFANPAVTLARMVTDTFGGIRPGDAPAFIVAQLVGGALAAGFFRWAWGPAAPGGARRTTRQEDGSYS